MISNALYAAQLSQPSIPWSPDGRYVLFARGNGESSLGEGLGLVVVDSETATAFRIDRRADPVFSPNSKQLAYRHEGTITAVDLATRKVLMADRPTRRSASSSARAARRTTGRSAR
ncbi:MAG: DPP IV N-terminal domain-containing protein [Myxococcota bacterium]|nr:DPP IV N-terminal domain-containing protein [Myxococcota bacterium]